MQKARGHTAQRHAPTACRQTVSGSLSLGSPPYFSPFPHGTRSLSVIGEYLALEDGPPGFPQGSTCPVVLGVVTGRAMHFVYGTVTPYGQPFQTVPLCMTFLTPRRICNSATLRPTTPCMQRLQPYTYTVWAPPLSLAATHGISFDFFSCGY